MEKFFFRRSLIFGAACLLSAMFAACGDDSSSSPSENSGTSSSFLDSDDFSSSSLYEEGLSSSVDSNDRIESSSFSFEGEKAEVGKLDLEVASVITSQCIADSVMADSMLDVYKSTGNFGNQKSSLADCAYSMTLEFMVGDAIMPSRLESVRRGADAWQEFKSAFYKFWQDDYGVGPCNMSSKDVVKKNQDSLSNMPAYFICTDKRTGYTSELNWVEASALQINTYGHECDSSEYKEIRGYLDSAMYVCENGCWRLPKDVEKEYGLCTSENKGDIKSGKIFDYICDSSWELNVLRQVDSRDNQEFNALKIAGLLWMTENFKTDTSKYSWDEIADAEFCPKGWRIPTSEEWMSMLDTLGGLTANASPMNLIKYAGTWSIWWSAIEVAADSASSIVIQYAPMDYSQSKKFSYSIGYESKGSQSRRYARCVKDLD